MAKTGQKRKTMQPFNIDRLPPYVHDAILKLRNVEGKTWSEIEDLSSQPYGDGKPGFVEWEKLETPVLELFPAMRLPHSSLHRWFDVRREQVRRDVMDRSAQARQIAEAFSGSVIANGDEAVVIAARDTFLSVLSEDSTAKGRISAGKALMSLAEVMQKVRTNDIRERKVAVEEQTLQIKLDLMKSKAGELVKAIEGADGAPPASREEMLAKAKDIYGVA